MSVGIEGDRGAGVAAALSDYLRVDAGGEKLREMRASQIVQAPLKPRRRVSASW